MVIGLTSLPTPARIPERMNDGDSAQGPGHSLPWGLSGLAHQPSAPAWQCGCPGAKQVSPPCSSTQPSLSSPEDHGSLPLRTLSLSPTPFGSSTLPPL